MKKFFLVFLSAGFFVRPAGALTLTCPEKMTTEQKVVNAPKSWKVGKSQFSPILSGVGIYDGPPDQLADLVPNNAEASDGYWIWFLNLDSPRDYWLECRYSRTTVTLSMPLPKGLVSCKATYDKDIHVDGNPAIKAITCE